MTTASPAPEAADTRTDVALDLRGIGMRFGAIWVLRNVDYQVRRGSIHALVGHNGAGKSTLMKIALGAYRPTEGTVSVDGAELTYSHPAEARRRGVGMVMQERSLIGTLSGLDNIFLNAERTIRPGLVRTRAETEEAVVLCDRLGISRSVLGRHAAEMSAVEQEMVEIAKAVRLGRNALILDEPTAPLSEREIATLFRIIRNAANGGAGIVLITHHLAEVFAISDDVTCLREGSVTLSVPTRRTDMGAIVEAILGEAKAISEAGRTVAGTAAAAKGAPILEVSDAVVGTKLTAPISFSLYPGEILGVAGLAGSGRTTLLRALFGDLRLSGGSMTLNGRPYKPRTPADAILRNVFLIPENRGLQGLLLTAPISENVVLAALRQFSRIGLLRMGGARAVTRRLMAALDIRARGPQQIVGELSGGNQQKVVLAKALAAKAELLLLDEPTFGVDIGAAAGVIRHVRELVAANKAAVWVTSDLQELLAVSDRIMVIADGGVRETIDPDSAAFNEAALVRAIQRRQYQQTAGAGLGS